MRDSDRASGRAARCIAAVLLAFALTAATAADTLRIGSKRFTESYILGEVIARTAARAGTAVEHRPGLGNTAILFAALKSGAIDVYPDYSGTVASYSTPAHPHPALRTTIARRGEGAH